MAEADLDLVIRQIAKTQTKSLMAAVKKRRDQIMARAAKAKPAAPGKRRKGKRAKPAPYDPENLKGGLG